MTAVFDWYQTTLAAKDPHQCGLVDTLLRHFELSDYGPARPQNGYQRGAQIARGSRVLCRLNWGGQPGINVMSTSSDAPTLAAALRELRLKHRPTRIDSAIDFEEEGLFDVLVRRLKRFALAEGLSINQQGDWTRARGRTLYLGSESSVARLVVYEKGFEQGVDRPHWIRIEARIRPKGDAREHVMLMDPMDVFSCSFLPAALDAIGYHHTLAKRSIGTKRRTPDEERTRSFLIAQYGAVLRQWADDLGGWDHLSHELAHRVATHGREIELDYLGAKEGPLHA